MASVGWAKFFVCGPGNQLKSAVFGLDLDGLEPGFGNRMTCRYAMGTEGGAREGRNERRGSGCSLTGSTVLSTATGVSSASSTHRGSKSAHSSPEIPGRTADSPMTRMQKPTTDRCGLRMGNGGYCSIAKTVHSAANPVRLPGRRDLSRLVNALQAGHISHGSASTH